MEPALRVISLGWGVQSWTLAAMVALGELPPVDFALHSDTTWERSATYEFARQWTPWLEDHDIDIHCVSDPKAAAQIANPAGGVFSPLYTLSKKGKAGQLRRSCTQRWKVAPVRRFIRKALAARQIAASPKAVELWLGISKDEWHRAKDSDVKYITHRFPLLELGMTRADCLAWLAAHDLPSPGKSACTFCPYHSPDVWRSMKLAGGADWQQAVEIDGRIRNKRPGLQSFVHSARIPLIEAVQLPEDQGITQLALSDIPCDSGFCFL